MFAPGTSLQPSLMFMGKARSRPIEGHFKGASLVYTLVLFLNITLGWKGQTL